MKVLITQHAKHVLSEIVAYYQRVGYGKYGRKIRALLIQKALLLAKFPLMGSEEQLLKELNLGHRYIVEGNYKIVYRIEGKIIYITDMFDTRRSPEDIEP